MQSVITLIFSLIIKPRFLSYLAKHKKSTYNSHHTNLAGPQLSAEMYSVSASQHGGAYS